MKSYWSHKQHYLWEGWRFEGTCGDEGSIEREISIRTYCCYVRCSCCYWNPQFIAVVGGSHKLVAQLNAVLGIGLGNMDTRNAIQEHIAGIQVELSKAERDVIRLGIQQEAKLERA